MRKVAIVTSIYTVHTYRVGDTAYIDLLWKRVRLLAKYFTVHLFCSETDKPRAEAIDGIVPYYRELSSFETHDAIQPATRMPAVINPEKDTKQFFVLMNVKTEMLKIVKLSVPASHYAWIDAGIEKILQRPDPTFLLLQKNLSKRLREDAVFIPGILPSADIEKLDSEVCWRFCGGLLIVPNALVDPFAAAVLRQCTDMARQKSLAMWEVNVWARIELMGAVPFQWARASFSDLLLDCAAEFSTQERRS